MDIGLEAAGFQTQLCVELDPDARETLKKNRPSWQLSEPGDLHELGANRALRQSGLGRGDVTILCAGPPCQPFSKAGYWATYGDTPLADERTRTLDGFLDVMSVARPEVVLLENVAGFTYSSRDDALNRFMSRLSKINRKLKTNYEAQLIVINAADYGVPQRRERIFVLAHKDGKQFHMPTPTHGVQVDAKPYLRAWDSIGDLDFDEIPDDLMPTGKWADLLPTIPEGRNYLWHTPKMKGQPLFGWRTRYWSFLLKLAKAEPSWTIQAAPGPATGPFHWRSRRLSPRELCRLQTIPDDYEVLGTLRSAQRQIGNAVPAAIGELLGLEIRRQWLGEKRVRRKLRLIPDLRKDCPPPEPTRRVPKKYWRYKASHDDHPGTGQGPAAWVAA